MSLVLDDLKSKLQMYTAQRDQTQVNYQQLCGAIHVLNETITTLESQNDCDAPEPLEQIPQGEDYGQTQLPSAE